MSADQIAMLQKMIDESRHIVFFGGAGVSTESGIPDFRSADGLFAEKMKHSPKRILSKPFLEYLKEEFFDYYRSRMLWPDKEPNRAHRKLAELEEAGRLDAVITQNIDGLHQAAGSRRVLELHGTTRRNYCRKCGREYSMEHMMRMAGVPRCECGGVIRPDIVLYEEKLNHELIMEAAECIRSADLLIIGGTTLAVSPAAKLIRHYKGRKRVIINRDIRGMECMGRLVIEGDIGDVLGQITVTAPLPENPVMINEEPNRRRGFGCVLHKMIHEVRYGI